MKLQPGAIFTGKYFTGKIEVIEVKEDTNELEVKLSHKDFPDSYWFETWDLEHTKQGFKDGSYYTERGMLYIDSVPRKVFELNNSHNFVEDLPREINQYYPKPQSKYHK